MKKSLFIGASSDIGIEVVKLLLKKNYYSYCTFYKNSQALKLIEKKNPQKINLSKLNLSQIGEVKKFINKLKNKTKKIDLLILGANIPIKRKKFGLLNFKSFKNKISGNFLSNVFLIQLLIKIFINNNLKIIHISSLASKNGSWGLSEYSSSKAALDNVLKCINYEYKKLSIKSIYLGAVKTKGYFFTNKNNNKKRKFITSLQAAKKILVNI